MNLAEPCWAQRISAWAAFISSSASASALVDVSAAKWINTWVPAGNSGAGPPQVIREPSIGGGTRLARGAHDLVSACRREDRQALSDVACRAGNQ